ncbi:hypothetical protein HAX54_034047 [Datura stramonium]|uniref:Protein TILLER ANGLE CONTROL 1 n=1 Tax=Datura stramonium TaxID=4076 RepID=A0ABS8SDY2_DATST|nr:hypothetical protein [Datura stramonium]
MDFLSPKSSFHESRTSSARSKAKQKLMKKVLKRKVHPDIETKFGKNSSQVKAASMLGLSCVKHVRVESSVSLLLTDQDVTAC